MDAGIPTDALIVHVLVSKYADHLPLYRQAQIYARQGVDLDRSTLADWVGRAAWYLRPLHERLLANLKASGKLFADETTAAGLDPGRGSTRTPRTRVQSRPSTSAESWAGVNRRVHGTTGHIVAEHFAAERPAVKPLPAGPYTAVLGLDRRITKDGMVSIGGFHGPVTKRSRRSRQRWFPTATS